ncbi:MAG: T9SS type A sorting domain-containing protein [Flavobacteriales bacterium]
MKRFSTFTILMMFVLHIQAQLSITEATVVAAQDPWGNVRPRLALNSQNEPVVIWTNPGESDLYSAVKVDNAFTTPQKLNPDGMDISAFDWSGPEIAANDEKIVVVMKQKPEMEGHIYIVTSGDGGLTWSDTLRVDESSAYMTRMPSVAIDFYNNIYVSYLRDNMEGYSDWAMSKLLDGADAFVPAVSVSDNFTDAVCDCCPSATLVQGNTVVVLYRNNETNLRDIRASVSYDAGETFSLQADMDDTNWMVNICPSQAPSAYITGNQLRSTWMSDATGDSRVYFSSYDLDSESFGGSQLIMPDASNDLQKHPAIAGSMAEQAVVYEVNATTQRDIFFAITADGVPFDDTEPVNMTGEMAGNQQRPHIAYANGVYHIVYTDQGGHAVQYQTIQNANSVWEAAHESLMLFPNPALERITLSGFLGNEKLEVVVRTATGQKVYEGNSLVIDVTMLQAGIYTVAATSELYTTVARFVKE